MQQLYYETWQATYRGQVPDAFLASLTPETWHPERRWQNTLLAVNAENEVVGICSFGPSRNERYSKNGEIYSVYVHPSNQGMGIGKKLMAAAMARLNGTYSRVFLMVLATNDPAIAFYHHLGFQETDGEYVDETGYGKLIERMMVVDEASSMRQTH